MTTAYVPDRGDVVWLDFSPQTGHELAGKRPAIIISPMAYNIKVGLALFMPITSQEKGYVFEIKLPDDLPISGVILTDQMKSLDWKSRNARRIGAVSTACYTEIIRKFFVLIV